MNSSSKPDAKNFFQRLERYLTVRLPAPAIMAKEVEAMVKEAKVSTDRRHKAFPEGAVLNTYISPFIAQFLREDVGLDPVSARRAFLSESHHSLTDIASGSPSRSAPHPFSKVIGITPEQVFAQWQGRTKVPPVSRSSPDLALRDPAPHRVVFEAKYFCRGTQSSAEKQLATNIYQAFFYRGLPRIEEKSPRPSWDYDYACLLVCDASPTGEVAAAWKSLSPIVRTACWHGANIYVMVLRGAGAAA